MSSSTPLAQYAASLRSSGTGASLGLERTDQVLLYTWDISIYFAGLKECMWDSILDVKRCKRCMAFDCFQVPLPFTRASKVWIQYGRPIPLVSMSNCFSPKCSEDRMNLSEIGPTMSHVRPMAKLCEAVEHQNLFKVVSNYVADWVEGSSM